MNDFSGDAPSSDPVVRIAETRRYDLPRERAIRGRHPVVRPGCVRAWFGYARRNSVEGLARDTACRVARQIGESAQPRQRVSAQDLSRTGFDGDHQTRKDYNVCPHRGSTPRSCESALSG